MNLISEIHHSCERKTTYLLVLQFYAFIKVVVAATLIMLCPSLNSLRKLVNGKVANRVAHDIWNAPWTLEIMGFKPRLITKNTNNLNCVSELIHHNLMRWDESKI